MVEQDDHPVRLNSFLEFDRATGTSGDREKWACANSSTGGRQNQAVHRCDKAAQSAAVSQGSVLNRASPGVGLALKGGGCQGRGRTRVKLESLDGASNVWGGIDLRGLKADLLLC
ncbi:MAG: hypothetical protein ACJAYU_003285 [Bradymonadia bacterium]